MSRGAEHDGRASIPAPSRYERNPTVIRRVPETGNNPEATSIPQSGDLPPIASGAGLRDADRPNPLQAETLKLPRPVERSGAFSERLRRAKRLLSMGYPLQMVADHAGLSRAELDLALWNNLPEPR